MNLSKALKEKNKKAKKMASLISRVNTSNIFVEGKPPAYDAKESLELAKEEVANFVKFKTALFAATNPIREQIFELGELKSLIKSLNNLSTTPPSGYGYAGVVEVNYSVTISQLEKDSIIEELEKRIEQLQDEIDAFNATTVL